MEDEILTGNACFLKPRKENKVELKNVQLGFYGKVNQYITVNEVYQKLINTLPTWGEKLYYLTKDILI